MKIIRKNNAIPGKNDEKCTTLEYSFNDKDIDVGVATITVFIFALFGKLTRKHGIILLLMYVAYVTYLIIRTLNGA